MASSKVFVYGKASVISASRGSSSVGSCRHFIDRSCKTSLTTTIGDASMALTQSLQSNLLSTARIPSALFFGDRKRAYGEKECYKPGNLYQRGGCSGMIGNIPSSPLSHTHMSGEHVWDHLYREGKVRSQDWKTVGGFWKTWHTWTNIRHGPDGFRSANLISQPPCEQAIRAYRKQ